MPTQLQTPEEIKKGNILYYGIQTGRSGASHSEILVEVFKVTEDYAVVEPVTGDGMFTVEKNSLYNKIK